MPDEADVLASRRAEHRLAGRESPEAVKASPAAE
jgi:hypothetical protein